jgi:hypothetical protein
MATARQKAAARKNIRKAQQARRAKSARGRTSARAKARTRVGSKTTARRKTTARPKRAARSKAATRARQKPARPKARRRAKPGAGRGKFFHIEVRPKSEFTEFRTQDVGSKGGIERVAGKRAGGAWSTQKWLIAKNQAHVEGRSLVGDSADARKVLALLGTTPKRIRADRFSARDVASARPGAKPTTAPRRAGLPSISAPQKGRKWA